MIGHAAYINDLREREYRRGKNLWMFSAFTLLSLYGGALVVEAMYYGGDMRVAILSVLAGTPLPLLCAVIYNRYPRMVNIPLIVAIATQITFLTAGTYLKELDKYFFVMVLTTGTVMIMKNFNRLIINALIMTFLNVIFILFVMPHLDWLNHYRFFIDFLFFIFSSIFFLIMTHNIEHRETASSRAFEVFSSLLQSTPNYMIITDENYRIRYISESMAQFAHYTHSEIAVGKPLIDLFRTKKLKLMFADILDSDGFAERIVPVEIDGEERHLKVISNKLSGDTGGVFIDIIDITPTIQSKLAAEVANKSKSQFLAAMSHEIRTPINAILGIAQIELRKDNLQNDHANALIKMHDAGNSLLGIINDILDMSKIETGKLELNPVEYDTPSLINDAVQLNIVRIGSKPINFILEIDENLASNLYGDELRLKQILNNLLSNAIKYTKKGYVKLSVGYETDGTDIWLRFTVEDTGQGMRPEARKLLFSEYQRFNVEANRDTEGTGLGLNITKTLVEMMDGSINVQSEYGVGSTFTVKVRQKAIAGPPVGAEVAERLKKFAYSNRKYSLDRRLGVRYIMPYGSVLVVDDMSTNLFVAEGLMAPYKLKIDTADSGFAAIEKIEGGAVYDIVFMDHMMPRMDGMETTRRLRESGYAGKIVALTANALVGNDVMFKKNGFDDFLTKPIDVRHLDLVLNKYIRDKYPEAAAKCEAEAEAQTNKPPPPAVNPKLLEVFRRDAKDSIAALRQSFTGGDLKLFTITAHGMKSALANVGEEELSAAARSLEEAGRRGDSEYIAGSVDSFITALSVIVNKLTPQEPTADDTEADEQDFDYLTQRLLEVISACDDYNNTAAYAALDLLKEKRWKKDITTTLEKIRDTLFLCSDFEAAAEMAQALMPESKQPS